MGPPGWPGTPPSPAGAAHSLRSAPGWGGSGEGTPGSRLPAPAGPGPPATAVGGRARGPGSRLPPPSGGPGGRVAAAASGALRGPWGRSGAGPPRPPPPAPGSGSTRRQQRRRRRGDQGERRRRVREAPAAGGGRGRRARPSEGWGARAAPPEWRVRARARVSRRVRGHGVGWGSGCPLGWGSSLSHPGLPGPRSSSLAVSLWTRPPAPTSPHSAGFSVSEFLCLCGWVSACPSSSSSSCLFPDRPTHSIPPLPPPPLSSPLSFHCPPLIEQTKMVEGGRHLVSEPCPGSARGPHPLASGRGLPPPSCRELACRAVGVGWGQQARLRAEGLLPPAGACRALCPPPGEPPPIF